MVTVGRGVVNNHDASTIAGVVNKLHRRNFKSRVWAKKFQSKVPFLEIPEFPYNTVWDRWKETSIRPIVSIQYRLLTDRQTDT